MDCLILFPTLIFGLDGDSHRSSVMPWENTFQTEYFLPSRDSFHNNSLDTSIRSHTEDGQLTLVVIVTTVAALGIVLLILFLFRIWCLNKDICLKRCNHRENRSQTTDCAVAFKSTSQHSIQATTIKINDHETMNSYTIKLVDNDLIVERQENTSQYGEESTLSKVEAERDIAEETDLVFKNWLLFNQREWDCHSYVLETKSLCSSPQRLTEEISSSPEDRDPSETVDRINTVSQQASTGFGFTQSSSSCHETDPEMYSYSYTNQLEYMNGPYGYMAPIFGYHSEIPAKKVDHFPNLEEAQRLKHIHPIHEKIYDPTFHFSRLLSTTSLSTARKKHRRPTSSSVDLLDIDFSTLHLCQGQRKLHTI